MPPINESLYSPPVPYSERGLKRESDGNAKTTARVYHAEIEKQENLDILYLMLAFRFINALLVQTFFQPDEYFQSLEPAWQMAFGANSGAWITWVSTLPFSVRSITNMKKEWEHQLRSSMHPALFAALYSMSNNLMKSLSTYPQFRAMIIVHAPKILQGLIAGLGDFYTWKLADKVYGRGSNYAWSALAVSIFSPWQWFCSTRTLSNSLETVLTVAALYYWPWSLYSDANAVPSGPVVPKSVVRTKSNLFGTSEILQSLKDMKELRGCLFLAAIACLLRPTNLLIWLSIVTVAVTRLGLKGRSKATLNDLFLFGREALLCGLAGLIISIISDRLYFGFWTFPPYQWLHFNISQDLAIFYGQNRPDYYFTEGIPLLLTTYLPFGIMALVSATSLSSKFDNKTSNIRFQFAFTVLVTVCTLSLISHKEVRFIYPLLPILHVLLAPHISDFFNFASIPAPSAGGLSNLARPKLCIPHSSRRALLVLLAITNVAIGLYVSLVHQRGVIDVMSFLRADYERLHLSIKGELLSIENETLAAFLMPCHSTPWRSHLVYPGLKAWALTCDPPLNLPAGSPERLNYRDEADRFFDNPAKFLKEEVGGQQRPWPRYIIAFEGEEGLEDVIKHHVEGVMGGWTLKRTKEVFNSHWHDDDRRKGKVMVWEMAQIEEVRNKLWKTRRE